MEGVGLPVCVGKARLLCVVLNKNMSQGKEKKFRILSICLVFSVLEYNFNLWLFNPCPAEPG